MAIRKSYVLSEIPGVLRPEYRVDGDGWRSYATREEAEKREAELQRETEQN